MFEYSSKLRVSDTRIPKINNKIIQILQNSENILDLGCVNGRLSNYVKNKKKYTGISYSQNDIDSLKAKGLNGILVNLEKEKIPIESESIDCVYAGHIIEHFEKAELIEIMTECRRVLKKGGYIILVTPTDYNSFFYAERTHIRPYNHGSLPGLLNDFEFKDTKRFYPPISFLPNKWQARLRFPLFFLKDIIRKEIVAYAQK